MSLYSNTAALSKLIHLFRPARTKFWEKTTSPPPDCHFKSIPLPVADRPFCQRVPYLALPGSTKRSEGAKEASVTKNLLLGLQLDKRKMVSR
jgi:hypothetical protein